MDKANVILLGPSGVGKSTLINAICGYELISSLEKERPYDRTSELEFHESEEYGIRFVDTVGFEPSASKQAKAVKLVQRWTEDGAKKKDQRKALDLVWFCVDGTAKRIFPTYINNFVKAVKIWKDIPVIVVVTKSYSELEQQDNVNTIREVFSEYSDQINLKDVIPVVAMPFNIREDVIVQSSGLKELMDRTLEVIPEGRLKREKVQLHHSIAGRRIRSRRTMLASVAAAVGIGLTKVDFSAAILLEPIERKLVDEIAKQYGIIEDERVRLIKDKLITSGTIGDVARKAVGLLRKVPAVNVKGIKIDVARIANAVVAGSIVAGIGESSRFVFEKIYLKDESTDSIEWIDKFLNDSASEKVVENIKKIFEKVKDMTKFTPATILTAIKEIFFDEEH